MSGPGGMQTNRDKRREARRTDLQRRQVQRQRERARKLRNRRIRVGSTIGGIVLLLAALGFLVYATIGHGGTQSTALKGSGSPANGATVDGFMQCVSSEGTVTHIHSYIEIYVNGTQQTVPPGIGIVAPEGSGSSALASNGNQTCLYPLHVHDGEPNIIHEEAPTKRTYTLGNFFDVWGQQLSSTTLGSHTATSAHALTFYVSDASGKMVKYTGNPRNIPIEDHETIAVLYNSPNVTPAPFTNWSKYNL